MGKRATKSSGVPAPSGQGLDAFQSQYDESFIIPKKIKAGLEQLGEAWMTETDFCKLADISAPKMAQYRDMFDEHVVAVKRHGNSKRVWAGTTEFAEQLRELARR